MAARLPNLYDSQLDGYPHAVARLASEANPRPDRRAAVWPGLHGAAHRLRHLWGAGQGERRHRDTRLPARTGGDYFHCVELWTARPDVSGRGLRIHLHAPEF